MHNLPQTELQLSPVSRQLSRLLDKSIFVGADYRADVRYLHFAVSDKEQKLKDRLIISIPASRVDDFEISALISRNLDIFGG